MFIFSISSKIRASLEKTNKYALKRSGPVDRSCMHLHKDGAFTKNDQNSKSDESFALILKKKMEELEDD